VASISIALPATVYAPGRARAAVRKAAQNTAVHADDRWRAEMIITELVTNAVRHGPGGPVEVAIEAGGAGLRGEVADPGQGFQTRTLVDHDAEAQGGRGLLLVDVLSDSWGLSAEGSRVWFEVAAQA
jgi:anti-sigma regulatory factor (Ser/Thr protein kinase)